MPHGLATSPPSILSRNPLVGEHREHHGRWVVLTENRQGYGHRVLRRCDRGEKD
jgi:hypothetical protein